MRKDHAAAVRKDLLDPKTATLNECRIALQKILLSNYEDQDDIPDVEFQEIRKENKTGEIQVYAEGEEYDTTAIVLVVALYAHTTRKPGVELDDLININHESESIKASYTTNTQELAKAINSLNAKWREGPSRENTNDGRS